MDPPGETSLGGEEHQEEKKEETSDDHFSGFWACQMDPPSCFDFGSQRKSVRFQDEVDSSIISSNSNNNAANTKAGNPKGVLKVNNGPQVAKLEGDDSEASMALESTYDGDPVPRRVLSRLPLPKRKLPLRTRVVQLLMPSYSQQCSWSNITTSWSSKAQTNQEDGNVEQYLEEDCENKPRFFTSRNRRFWDCILVTICILFLLAVVIPLSIVLPRNNTEVSASTEPEASAGSTTTNTTKTTGTVTITPTNTTSAQCFQSNEELFEAVDVFLLGHTSNETRRVAMTYGWPINQWCFTPRGGVTNLTSLFSTTRNPLAATFNEDLSGWNVSQVTTMSRLFQDATAFNQPLASWDVRRVTDLSYMFKGASSFNQNLSRWNVSNVENMSRMFLSASSFNTSLSNWQVDQARDLRGMFRYALAFNQDLCVWGRRLSILVDPSNMFEETSCASESNPALTLNPPGPFCAVCRTR